MQPWVEMECYQLDSGKQVAQIDSLDLGSQQVVREQQITAIQKLGMTSSDFCTISCCTPDPAFRFSELGADNARTLFFMPANTEYDIYVPAGAQTAYVGFSQEEFLRGARALNPMDWECAPQQLTSIPLRQQARLNHLVDMWLTAVDTTMTEGVKLGTKVMQELLLQSVLLVATDTRSNDWRGVSATGRAHAFYTYRKARAFIEECFEAEIIPFIADICRSVGVSERTLQYAFQTNVNMSPLSYLRVRRLNRVRSVLHAADPRCTRVTAVAMQFGFLHLGRFAADYKKLFDEAPSVTLAR